MLSTDEKQPFAPNAEKPAPAATARGAGRTEFACRWGCGYAARPDLEDETYVDLYANSGRCSRWGELVAARN